MSAPLLKSEHRWSCPNCMATKVTSYAAPHTPFHECRGLRGLTAPLVEDGVDCKVETVAAEDYEGPAQMLQYDGEGRAISAVVTTRDDGNDSRYALRPGKAQQMTTQELSVAAAADEVDYCKAAVEQLDRKLDKLKGQVDEAKAARAELLSAWRQAKNDLKAAKARATIGGCCGRGTGDV